MVRCFMSFLKGYYKMYRERGDVSIRFFSEQDGQKITEANDSELFSLVAKAASPAASN